MMLFIPRTVVLYLNIKMFYLLPLPYERIRVLLFFDPINNANLLWTHAAFCLLSLPNERIVWPEGPTLILVLSLNVICVRLFCLNCKGYNILAALLVMRCCHNNFVSVCTAVPCFRQSHSSQHTIRLYRKFHGTVPINWHHRYRQSIARVIL